MGDRETVWAEHALITNKIQIRNILFIDLPENVSDE
jgi:hypothetical protein